jgi:hypothetical protein
LALVPKYFNRTCKKIDSNHEIKYNTKKFWENLGKKLDKGRDVDENCKDVQRFYVLLRAVGKLHV